MLFRSPDPTQSETFFVSAALTPARSDAPWVVASVVEADRLTVETLAGQRVVFLANVSRLTDAQIELLENFVAAGGGLVVAPGDRIDPEWYNRSLHADGRGLLPARFDAIKHERDHDLGDVNIAGDSLEVSWLRRFRKENGVDLIEARFAHWWRMDSAFGVRSSVIGGDVIGGDNGSDDSRRRAVPAGDGGEQTNGGELTNDGEDTTPNAEDRALKTAPPLSRSSQRGSTPAIPFWFRERTAREPSCNWQRPSTATGPRCRRRTTLFRSCMSLCSISHRRGPDVTSSRGCRSR